MSKNVYTDTLFPTGISEKEFLTNYSKYVPEEFKKAKPRKSIIKLAKMMNLAPGKITVESPEYWGLCIVCPEDIHAEIALAMGQRKPKTLSQIAEVTKISEEELEPILQEMCMNCIIEWNYENPQHEKQYQVPLWIPGPCEFTNMHEGTYKDHPEVGRFFDCMGYFPAAAAAHMVAPGGSGQGMHVIPVEKAIENNPYALDIEHITHWLDKYDGQIAASTCSCRSAREMTKESCGDDKNHWCIVVGDMADFAVETQKGSKYITKEEALRIFKKAEELGYVHQTTSNDGPDKIIAICNCQPKVCIALRTSQLFNTPNMSRCAFVSHIDKNKCVACGQCVQNCPAGALKLGQKLCTKEGEVQYPKQVLPDDHKWGPEMWDWDYLAHAREQSHKTGTAPCKSVCPAHIGVQGYLKLAAQGKYDEALELIKKDNPFPAVCGRICNRRCEEACTRGQVDRAVAIDEVKKFIAQRDLDASTRFVPKVVAPIVFENEFPDKIAIIGAGPAGLTCAYYLALMGYKPTVFEKHEQPGGMMVYGIPSFKLEKDVVAAEIDILKELGVEIKCGVNIGEDITLNELREQGYKAFYIAIGCQGSNKAGIPGDNADGVISAVDHLGKVHEGNYAITGKTVVIGGGNVAIDAARTSTRIGASEVSMFCLEQRDEMPASDEEIAEAQGENIAINCGWGPKEILVENGKVSGVVFKKCVAVRDASGKFAPTYDDNDTITVEADYVITSIGQRIEWGNLITDENIEFVHGNYPKADGHTYQTSQEDIFVGGDVYTGPKFVIDAIASARLAADSIHRYVRPNTNMTSGRDWREINMLDKSNIVIPGYDVTPRQVAGVRNDIDVKTSFRDPSLTFTEEQVKKETSRCLGCGVTIADQNRCLGCGLCTTKCKFDAISLSRDLPEQAVMTVYEDAMKDIIPHQLKRMKNIAIRTIKEKVSK